MEKVKTINSKVKSLYSNLHDYFGNLRIPWLLPRLYLKIFVFGLILVGLNYSYVPNLTYCSNLFGGDFCSPVGIYLIAFASLPGYLLINATLPNVATDNDSLYSLVVFISTLLIYSVVGYVFSKKKSFKLGSTGVVYLIFLSLLFALLFLISLMQN